MALREAYKTTGQNVSDSDSAASEPRPAGNGRPRYDSEQEWRTSDNNSGSREHSDGDSDSDRSDLERDRGREASADVGSSEEGGKPADAGVFRHTSRRTSFLAQLRGDGKEGQPPTVARVAPENGRADHSEVRAGPQCGVF